MIPPDPPDGSAVRTTRGDAAAKPSRPETAVTVSPYAGPQPATPRPAGPEKGGGGASSRPPG